MDIMKLKSKVMVALANRIVKKAIWESTGIDADFDFHQVTITHEEGKVKAHLDLNLEVKDSEFTRIIKNMGL